MKPDWCWICETRPTKRVRFSDYAKQPLAPDGTVMDGDDEGIAWFCADHLPAAIELLALPVGEAMRVLEERFGVQRDPSGKKLPTSPPVHWARRLWPF